MDHVFHPQGHIPSLKSALVLSICLSLHLACVRLGFGNYDISELFRRFGIESITSVLSGLGSVALAVIMGKHYWLRNKLLKKELKEKDSKVGVDEQERKRDTE